MFKIVLQGLFARKRRLVTSALAVVLGVAFTAGTLVLTDTMTHIFNDLSAGVYKGTDAVVRAKAVFDAGYASDANFTTAAEAELYVALARESVQAGRSDGRQPQSALPSWQDMAARLDTPEGKADLNNASSLTIANYLLEKDPLHAGTDANTRYTNFLETYPSITSKVPLYLIASYLGISAEFLSRIRKKRKPS